MDPDEFRHYVRRRFPDHILPRDAQDLACSLVAVNELSCVFVGDPAILDREDSEADVVDVLIDHAEAGILLLDVSHHQQISEVVDHLIICLPIVKQVLIEHGVVIVLVVVLNQLLLLELIRVVPDHGDVLAYVHGQVVTSLNVGLLLLEEPPELNDFVRGVLEEPVKSLLHLRGLNEGLVVDLFLGVVLKVTHDQLEQVVLCHREDHLLERGSIQAFRHLH